MAKVERVGSVDLLRGMVMFVMIFVNCGFYKRPWWSDHFVSGGSGMTYVDVIFPAFLFLAGVAVPLAFERYENTVKGKITNLYHVLYRAATLMIMGIIFVNNSYNIEMGGSQKLWFVISLLIICFTWQQYKGNSAIGRYLSDGVRLVGVGGLIWFFFIYHQPGASNCAPTFTTFFDSFCGAKSWTQLSLSWGGILGLIGRSYLLGSLVYMLIGRRTELLMMAVLLVSMVHVVSFGGGLQDWWYFSGGDRVAIVAGQGAVTMLGVVAGAKLLEFQKIENRKEKQRDLMAFLGYFAIIAFLISIVLRRLYGIHKDSTFPAYVYASVAYTCVAWLVLYYLYDVKEIENFATRFLLQVGSVPLTAYVMSSLVRMVTELIPIGKTHNLHYYLFKSLGPLVEKLQAPLWCVQVTAALQTIFFAVVVCLICIGLKKQKIFLKI